MQSKTDIVNIVSQRAGLSKSAALVAVDAVFEAITQGLVNDEDGKSRIFGFGMFSAAHVESRTGRNPRTGEEITIPAHMQIKFTAAKDLKDTVNQPKRMIGGRRRAG